MRKYKLHITIILLLMLSRAMLAQENYYVDVNISNSNPAVNEQFRLDYILKFKGNSYSFSSRDLSISRPELEGFKIVDQGGGMDMNMSFGFRNRDKDMTLYKYSFILEAEKEGKYTIAPFTYTFKGKPYKSGEITISVSKAGSVKRPSGSKEDEQGLKPDDLFARTIVSKSSVYQGEPLIVTHKIYSKKNFTGLNAKNFPSYEGFVMEEIDIGKLQVKRERVDGTIYQVVTLSKRVLFPQKTGSLEIGDFSVDAEVEVVKTRPARNHRERYFYGEKVQYSQRVKKSLKSLPKEITVMPLPAAKPQSFEGMVGSFRMNVELTKDSIPANQATNLKISLSGSGNIKMLQPPAINFPPDFEVYDPEISTNRDISDGGVSGTKVFDYVIIPRSEGQFEIPSIEFSYFDVLKKEYVTLRSESFKIMVGEGRNAAGQTTMRSYNKEEVKKLGSDIMYIYESPLPLHDKNKRFVNSWLFWLLLFLPFVALGAFYFIHKKNKRIQADASLVKTRRATKLAKNRLKTAKKLKDEAKENEFYQEINRALLGYLSDRFNIPMAELSRENIESKLSSSKINQKYISSSTELLDACDYARFAPGPREEKLKNLYEQAVELISNIEKDLK
jgi:hypothetical protein